VSTVATPARARAAGPDPRAAAVFGLLVLACLGAFFLTQRLKHTPTAVGSIRLAVSFAPTPAPDGPSERMSFHIIKNDRVTVAVVDGTGAVAATVIFDHPLRRYKRLLMYWNGHRGPCPAPGALTCASTESGPLVAPGTYRLRITLLGQHRTLYSPQSFRLQAIAR
jgi:hypothetical protein